MLARVLTRTGDEAKSQDQAVFSSAGCCDQKRKLCDTYDLFEFFICTVGTINTNTADVSLPVHDLSKSNQHRQLQRRVLPTLPSLRRERANTYGIFLASAL